MDEHTTILIPFKANELADMIRSIIRTELERLQREEATKYEAPGLTKKPVLKAGEVCQLLSISRQTLHVWIKEGLLKAYKVKSRVFFLTTDVDKLLTDKKTD